MKKAIKSILFTAAIIGTLIPSTLVSAKSLMEYKVTSVKGEITVSGTASEGMSAVQTFVYKEDGKTLVAADSVPVEANHTFTDTIKVPSGKYIVKSADYDGGTFKTANIDATKTSEGNEDAEKIKKKNTEGEKTAPKTGEV